MPEPDPLPSIKTPWDSATPPSGVAPGEVPPIPIPDHTLIRRVGKGSYGEVWLARNVLGVYRAVKIIHRGSFDDDRPFEREFAGMQRFEPVSRSHESQLNILQVGRGPDCFYYVMELADDMGRGAAIDEASYTPRNLRSELLLRGRLPVDECVRLGLALTTALEHLHRHGLVHRDIKPSNIVFVNGMPKLADIGLVALAESTMSFVGTEGYLPPEGPGTVPADLFSLGKVLYEISTGRDRQQFPELPTGITELPDRAALAELNEVILRACAPDVKQRYESAAEMHADLALLQSGKSVARMRAVERRLKFVARAGAVVTGIALLAGAAFFYQQVQTREARRLAGENKALAEEKTQLADDKSKLAEENREQLVRLRVDIGVRLLDQDNSSGALLWFAEVLPLVTNKPAEESIHRIRIQQVLAQIPRLLQVMAHESSVLSTSFSPDGHRVATGTRDGHLRVWDAQTGKALWDVTREGVQLQLVQFTRDGRRLFISSSPSQARAVSPRTTTQFAEMVDAEGGNSVFPRLASNLVCSALSPDDRWLAVALTNHVIRVLDARNGAPVLDLTGHSNGITMLSFSRDGSLLASASLDQTARLWRLPSGETVGPPLRHDQPVRRTILSPDARRVATATDATEGSDNCLIQTWDAQTGATIGPPIKAMRYVFALAFDDATGRRLLTGDHEFVARLWNAETHVELLPPLKMNSTARCWAFSPDGSSVAIGSDDNTARIWNLDTGKLRFPPFGHIGWAESVQFSPDGTRLFMANEDGTAKLWGVSAPSETGGRLRMPAAAPNVEPWQFPATLSPGRRHLWVGMDESNVRLVNVETLTEEGKPMPAPDGDRAGRLEFDATGRQWAAALGEFYKPERSRSVSLWRQETDRVRHFKLPHGGPAYDLRFTPDGKRLVTLGKDPVVRTWITQDGSLQGDVRLPGGYRWALLSHDARRVLLFFADDEGRLFDIESASLIGRPFRHRREINAVCFSPDGRRFATVSGDQTGRIWDAATGEPLTPPFKHGGSLFGVDWSPDGKRLVTAGLMSRASLWDTATGESLLSPLVIGTYPTLTAHWSLDGRFIVTRSDENFVRVWDAATAEAVTPLLKHEGYIRLARLAANNRLLTLSDPNVLRAWDLTETKLPADVLADYARVLAGLRLSGSGASTGIKAADLADLFLSLRARAPELFSQP